MSSVFHGKYFAFMVLSLTVQSVEAIEYPISISAVRLDPLSIKGTEILH